MQIVIDIPKYVYDTIIACDGYISDCDNHKVGNAIKDAILIPSAGTEGRHEFLKKKFNVPLVKEEREDLVVDDDKLALLEKTYADFCKCESGEGWLRIDGIDYYTDVGYALEGMKIFMEVFKQRLAEKEGGK